MGTLRSDFNHSPLSVNGVVLGEAVRDVDENGEPFGEYRWDDSAFPSGVILEDGSIVVDDMEETL